MASRKVQLKDNSGNKAYPVTSSACVGMSDGSGSLDSHISKITTEYNVSLFHPTEGIDGGNKYTLETAIAKVPAGLRNVGMKVTFLNTGGNTETWEYQGVNFLNTDKWIKIGGNRINEIYNTIGDFCASYKDEYSQLDETGNLFPLGNYQYRVTDYIDVSHINALYYNIYCNPTNKSAIIAAYSENKEFIVTNSIISEESTLGSTLTGTWIKSDNTYYIRISFIQNGESSCIVTSVNDRYALELDKKLEHVGTDDIENRSITPEKLDRVYASYSFGQNEFHSNYINIDNSISALSIKSESGNITINSSFAS